ncbi:cytochrome c oxidase subunit I [Paraburkholderia diazotrophica]|uniref:Cytochrome c oxidase subunit 1 n=1 Tax=Paraburkholderia diazotrophica TaxID=667676 RepID=A0A1H6YVY8_9BURK|nr:cytochrome c oxidase subunit I [Paraburkholderia diazotrophica]SEJ41522.1 cytochrome c oxidase subunit 1/cytochrome c oxidase subunit I+III [Paraburkholderia diazotrophica]
MADTTTPSSTSSREPLERTLRRGVVARGSAAEKALRERWETPPGWRGWLSTVDHKRIGIRYLVTAFVFLIAGGVEALIMRVQLAQPNGTVLTPEQYNQLFTMHGVTMIFLYALPVLSGFSNYLWPLILGARDMAFPRLNAFSYWIFLFAAIFLYASFPLGEAPDAGWFNYVPLSGLEYDTGPNIDVYALGMVLLGISTTVGAVNFVVTLLRMRASGMSLDRIPVLVWGTMTASCGNLLAVPSVSLAFLLLWMDRRIGTHFFDVANGGRALLWQHLFWIFAHPWVYVVVLPAMGIVSDALPVFCRRPLVGYGPVALSTVATMLIGFVVWIHHMFATGLPALALSLFGAASMAIAVPSAIATFAWIATIWTGRPVFRVPFYYFAGFVLLFVIGGVSGVMTAAVPFDWQLTDTYFVVAHLHYVLLGINVFPVIGGVYFWFPKFTGRMMSERIGKFAFWVMFIGFNVAFFPMHLAGLLGMPRRIYTYAPDMGWSTVNLITSVGSFVLALGILIFLCDLLYSLRRGAVAGDNPWDAGTLEWSTTSPPPPYNFAVAPTIASRHPLWEGRIEEEGQNGLRSSLEEGFILDRGREALGTTALEARPDVILKMPEDSYTPFVLSACATLLFAGLALLAWWLVAAMLVGCAASIIVWLWPERRLIQREPQRVRDAGS